MRYLTIGLLLTLHIANAQVQEFVQPVSHFEKVVASPRINVVLKEGNEESVTIRYDGVEREKIRIKTSGKKLCIYLEDARFTQKRDRDNSYDHNSEMYEDAYVTAYVTYKKIKALEVRRDQKVSCESNITSKKFKLKAYGDNELRLRSLNAKLLRVSLYGDNTLRISNGETGHQKYSLYGDNKVEARGLISHSAKTSIYGDASLSLNTIEDLRLNSFGDHDIILTGSPVISKGLVFGSVNITRR